MLRILFTVLAIAFGGGAALSDTFFDPQTAAELVANNKAIIIDVREAGEITQGMAKPALWFPTSKVKAGGEELENFLKTLDKDKTIIVYCSTGRRASIMVDILRARGFTAENLGGYKHWADAKLPVAIPLSFGMTVSA